MTTKKIIILAVFGCFIVGTFLVATKLIKTSAPTDWKTYKDASLGFVVDYPANLLMEKEGNAVSFLDRSANSDGGNGLVSIIRSQNPSFAVTKIEDIVKKITNDPVEQKILLGGRDALVTYLKSKPDSKIAYVLKDNFLFTIITYNVDYERVWNSFKFLNQ